MTFTWQLFLLTLALFLIGTAALGLLYAGAAEEQAEHERGALARFTLRVCRYLGITPNRRE